MNFSAFNRASWLVGIATALAISALPAIAKKHGVQELLNGYLALESEGYDRAIGHFTRAIESDHLSVPRLSDAYRARGDAYFYREKLNLAVDDYNLALHLNPKNASALNNRGNAFTKKGLFELAMSDFDATLRLDPKFALAYQNRANVHFYFGRFRAAAEGYASSQRLNPSDPFSAIWLFLARKRKGENGTNELRHNMSTTKQDDWSSSISALFLGKMGSDRFMAMAEQGGRIGEICEAHFYIGQVHLLNDDRSKAMTEFRRALAACPATYVEHTAADMELRAFRTRKRR